MDGLNQLFSRLMTLNGAPVPQIPRPNQVQDFLQNVPNIHFLNGHHIHPLSATNYAYSFPSETSVNVVEAFITESGKTKEETTIIDYGCGRALWSRFFLENGFRISAVDCEETAQMWVSSRPSFLEGTGNEIHLIRQGHIELPEDCENHILFFSWPENYNTTPYAGNVLREFRERNGKMAIFVGEWEYYNQSGASASKEFFIEAHTYWKEDCTDGAQPRPTITPLNDTMVTLRPRTESDDDEDA